MKKCKNLSKFLKFSTNPDKDQTQLSLSTQSQIKSKSNKLTRKCKLNEVSQDTNLMTVVMTGTMFGFSKQLDLIEEEEFMFLILLRNLNSKSLK